MSIYAELTDSVGTPVRVQGCSCTEAACWVFMDDSAAGTWHLGERIAAALHLTPDQCRQLIAGLEAYLAEEPEERDGV